MMTDCSKAYDGRAIATLFVISMILSMLPISNVSAEDSGNLYHLQAQDIQATFDSSTELTTISWRNIDSLAEPNALDDFYNAVYKLYRHTDRIDETNIQNATLIHEIDACDSEAYAVKYLCLGGANGSHPGHTYSHQVEPGTNDTFFYGITTTITAQDGSETVYDSLISNDSAIYDPITEITTPIRTPYNLIASFDPSSSVTSLSWINYNDIFYVLPEDGPDAYQTRVWMTYQPITRSTSSALLGSTTPIAQVATGVSSLDILIPDDTDREVYYAVTYLLPNYFGAGQDYEDIRFLSNNALETALAEDNMPATPVTSSNSFFAADSQTGGGTTTITWSDVLGEEGESYAIYTSGEAFNKTNQFGANQIGLVSEGISEFEYEVPVGRLGTSHYCVVVIDSNGIFDEDIESYSCSSVYEDAFYNWVAEPTNVMATFMGDSETLITWSDQLGAEGEKYHIWRSNYLVSGTQFTENVTVEYQGTVTDGVQQFTVQVPSEVDRTSFYFVTSEALYQHHAGPYHYTELQQNWFGPVYEETVTPAAPRINSIDVEGEISIVTIEWLNDQQLDGEKYSIWQHEGAPFGTNEDEVSVVSEENGWNLFDGDITDTGSTLTEFTFSRIYSIPDSVERNIWYAITVEDAYGNTNLEAFPGSGGNSIKVKEDTTPPTATYQLFDENNQEYLSPSLVSGSYSIRLSINEYLFSNPTIDITTSTGGDITNGPRQMLMYADNLLDPFKGPEYYHNFIITSSVSAGLITITADMVDESYNNQQLTWTDRSLDAQGPVLTVFSPASSDDGSKYLAKESMMISAGATDDVKVEFMQYKFIFNYSTSNTEYDEWITPANLQDVYGDGTAFVFVEEYSAGNFANGEHAIRIRAVDSAGNENIKEVKFMVDYCYNDINGTTNCQYAQSIAPPPEPIVVEPSFSDPPYVFVWVSSGIAFIAIILMLFVISTGMKGPRKKQSDDDYDDDDWMSEFIGTTQQVDMDSITNTMAVPAEQPEENPDDEESEDDPFSVNVVQRKSRRTKSKPQPEPEPEVDDDDAFFGLDDAEFEDDEEVEEKPKPRRKVGRRPAPKNAPKRRPTRRRKSED
tara:strand:- start:138 stop:3389 length:3252 start_codon:yes stop_codon:yes gene_type:complete